MNKIPLLAAIMALSTGAAQAAVERSSFSVTSDPGVAIAVHTIIDTTAPRRGSPVILLHGARVPGLASFDLPVEGGSLAADLARAGLAVYIVDLRGYGASTRPAAMNELPVATIPLVRTGAVVRDLSAVVDAVRQRSGAENVSLLGWATGGHWAGSYAALFPERVSKVVFYNTLYGYTATHPALGRGSAMANPESPERFNIARFKNYRLNDAASLLPSWDRSIPLENKAAWRDPAVAQAYVAAALASDPTSAERDPASFRAPSGAMADSFLLAMGAALWDARLLAADALIVRSGNDFWSRPEDVSMLRMHLAARDAGTVEVFEIPGATHYVHLDRPERGRQAFLDAVVAFLRGGES